MTTAKICGLSTPATLDAAIRHGASHVGFVFFPASPRHVTFDKAAELAARVPGHVARVGVFVDPEDEMLEQAIASAALDVLQLHKVTPARAAAIRARFGIELWVAVAVRTRGDLDEAVRFYRAAFAGTAEALRHSPDDPQRIFDHAQNVFYLADIAHTRGQLKPAESGLQEYKRLARRMIEIDPSNPKWQMEGIYADTNLGVILNDEGRYDEAAATFENARGDRQRLAAGE